MDMRELERAERAAERQRERQMEASRDVLAESMAVEAADGWVELVRVREEISPSPDPLRAAYLDFVWQDAYAAVRDRLLWLTPAREADWRREQGLPALGREGEPGPPVVHPEQEALKV